MMARCTLLTLILSLFLVFGFFNLWFFTSSITFPPIDSITNDTEFRAPPPPLPPKADGLSIIQLLEAQVSPQFLVYLVSHKELRDGFIEKMLRDAFGVEVRRQDDYPAFDTLSISCERFSKMVQSGRIIHSFGNVKSNIISLYDGVKQMNKSLSIQDFIRAPLENTKYDELFNKVTYWRHHNKSWMNQKNVFQLNIEELKLTPTKVLKEVGSFLEIPLNPTFQMNLTKLENNQVHLSKDDLEDLETQEKVPLPTKLDLNCNL